MWWKLGTKSGHPVWLQSLGVCRRSSSLMDSIQTSELQNPSFGLNTNWLLKPLLWWKSAVCGKKGNYKQISCLFVHLWWVHWRAVARTSIFLLHLQPRPSVPVCAPEGFRTGAERPGSLRSRRAQIRKTGQTFLESWGKKLEGRKVAEGITRSHLIISRGKTDPDLWTFPSLNPSAFTTPITQPLHYSHNACSCPQQTRWGNVIVTEYTEKGTKTTLEPDASVTYQFSHVNIDIWNTRICLEMALAWKRKNKLFKHGHKQG